MNWLLIFVPAAIGLRYLLPDSHTLMFAAACAAVIPLAGWLGRATEHLANRTGESIGGLLNATFGNAAELIIGIMALRKGLIPVVKASLTGSIIGNLLLVMGASIIAGGVAHKTQQFNPRGARVQSTMLTLSAIALIAPAAYHHLAGAGARLHEQSMSAIIAVIMLLTYALGLLFTLRTHRQFFAGGGHGGDHGGAKENVWPVSRALAVLGGSTAMIAWVSEILIRSVEDAAHALGMSDLFIGVIVVAVIGNAAEHYSAITVARQNRMDLSLAIAVGSSIQIALFVAPVLVLISHLIAPRPMDIVFTVAEVGAIALAIAITGQIAGDGESNWLEGVQLLAVYLILVIVFYFFPG